MIELVNGLYCLTTGYIPKNIDCVELMRVRFTIDSDRNRMNFNFVFTEYEIQSQILPQLACFETKRNVDDVFN